MNKSPFQDRIDNFSNLKRNEQYGLYLEFLEEMLIHFYVDAIEFNETCPKIPEEEFSEKFLEFTRFWLKCRIKRGPDGTKEEK